MNDHAQHPMFHFGAANDPAPESHGAGATIGPLASNPIRRLRALGQSIWLDELRRSWLVDGRIARLVVDGDVTGVTSNPATFEQALGDSDAYAAELDAQVPGTDPRKTYERIALTDARAAADLLRPCYDASGGSDGYVSLEVSPHLAQSSVATIAEARRLWRAFDRSNAMIKIPATEAGLIAIKTLLAEGININVTLLFGLERYRQVVNAFLAGLEQRYAKDPNLAPPASVASFFVSRIDQLVDAELDARDSDEARTLRGRAAIAAARLVWSEHQYWTSKRRWQRLAARGARPQRLLWASTSTKTPAYPDVKYVEALIGPDTITTLPSATLDAYRDHGQPLVRINDEAAEAIRTWQRLQALGIGAVEVAERLEREGIDKFVQAFDSLLAGIEQRGSMLAAAEA